MESDTRTASSPRRLLPRFDAHATDRQNAAAGRANRRLRPRVGCRWLACSPAARTDVTDAQGLCRLARAGVLHASPLPPGR